MGHLKTLFTASFFFSAHLALLSYINSSSIAHYLPETLLGLIYVIGAIITILLLTFAPTILRRYGNWKVTITTLLISAVSLVLISVGGSTPAVIGLFVVYLSLNTFIWYLFDIFIEHYSKNENTGRIRGIYLTLCNIAWVGAPLIVAKVVTASGFQIMYLLAALLFAPILLIIGFKEHDFKDKQYKVVRFASGWHQLLKRKDIRTITVLYFILQFFFAWMVIYAPFYLTTVHGFTWENLGIIFTAMLLPFVLLPYPTGRLADKVLGEKEMLIGGLAIMSVATFLFATASGGVITFALLLFLSRVGASVVETMCESYFFKHVTERETVFISFYRDMVPLAYIIAPLLGTLLLFKGNYSMLYIILSSITLIGTGIACTLKDSR